MEQPGNQSLSLHFTHEHPLECSDQLPLSQNVSCSGCRLKISPEDGGNCFSCKPCQFFLHEACSNFPPRVQHVSHPDHSLSLVPMSGTTRVTSMCESCGNHVTGFYYYCAVCEISYHALCLSFPLSVSINCHPHSLKLEFSLSYEFRCDMCNRPSYKRWFYRCSRCEFDIHLRCAISRISKLETSNFSIGNFHFDATAGKELMRLLTDKFMKTDTGADRSPVSGWFEISKSPGGTNFMKGVRIVSPSSGESTQIPDDKSFLLSEISPAPSYQFSDAYFSIDLAKSFTNNEKNQFRKDGGIVDGPEVKDKMNLINTMPPTVIVGYQEKKRLAQSKAMEVENLMNNEAFFGRTSRGGNRTGQKPGQRDILLNQKGDKVADSDNGNNSSWRKLFFWCC